MVPPPEPLPAPPPHALPVISALVVEPDLSDAILIASTLAACRLHVTVAESFAQSRERLSVQAPHVLVTAVRLAEYNGLHVVLRAKAIRRDCAAIVTSTTHDPVLRADGEALGATFLLKPLIRTELATAVFRTLFRGRDGAASGPLRPPFERRVAERRSESMLPLLERRRSDRRRDLASLLRVVARNS